MHPPALRQRRRHARHLRLAREDGDPHRSAATPPVPILTRKPNLTHLAPPTEPFSLREKGRRRFAPWGVGGGREETAGCAKRSAAHRRGLGGVPAGRRCTPSSCRPGVAAVSPKTVGGGHAPIGRLPKVGRPWESRAWPAPTGPRTTRICRPQAGTTPHPSSLTPARAARPGRSGVPAAKRGRWPRRPCGPGSPRGRGSYRGAGGFGARMAVQR